MRSPLVYLLGLLLSTPACARSAGVDLNRLKLPPQFRISIFAEAPAARMMAFSPGGVLLVSETNPGSVVALPDPNHTGRAEKAVTVLQDLNAPHGIAFHESKLYIAETDKVVRYDWDEAQLRATHPQLVAHLPSSGGGHFTRTLAISGGKLYVSVGSSCNVCVEKDERRAAVLEMNPDGTGQRIFARGLRNAVGLAFNPISKTLWAGDNGTDWLGDDLPPEEVNELKAGGNYGWPYCYGDRVPNRKFGGTEQRCASTMPAKVEMQAHSAPLGVAFYTGQTFPAEYRGDLFVALHGSWNRSVPAGYKVVRLHFNDKGQPEGGAQDFVTGWLAPGEKRKGVHLGRPVGVATGPEGALYISDDDAGVIYRVTAGQR